MILLLEGKQSIKDGILCMWRIICVAGMCMESVCNVDTRSSGIMMECWYQVTWYLMEWDMLFDTRSPGIMMEYWWNIDNMWPVINIPSTFHHDTRNKFLQWMCGGIRGRSKFKWKKKTFELSGPTHVSAIAGPEKTRVMWSCAARAFVLFRVSAFYFHFTVGYSIFPVKVQSLRLFLT